MTVLTEQQAMQQKEEILEAVAYNNESWMDSAYTRLEIEITNLPQEFLGETIRHHIEPIVGSPPHHNAWGALIKRAIKKGLLRPTGVWTNMLDKKSHGRRSELYRR